MTEFARVGIFDPPEDIHSIAARGVGVVRRSIEAEPWGSGLIDVVAEMQGFGPEGDCPAMTLVVRIQAGYADPAHDWRARFGRSFGPCPIVIRPGGQE